MWMAIFTDNVFFEYSINYLLKSKIGIHHYLFLDILDYEKFWTSSVAH